MIYSWLMLLFICFDGTISNREVIDYVDLIEINHVYDDGKQKPRFEQSVYYRWKKTYLFVTTNTGKPLKRYGWGFEVMDWRQLTTTGFPVKNNLTGNWEQRFWDDRSRCYRKIISKSFKETHTLYDVESENRSLVSANHRELLNKPEIERK